MRHGAIVAAAALPGAFGFSPTAGVPQGVAETEGAEYSAQWPSRRAVAAHHGSCRLRSPAAPVRRDSHHLADLDPRASMLRTNP
jgi:hypothetical protein